MGLGKLSAVYGDTDGCCVGFLRERGYALLPLTPGTAEVANTLPWHHADPTDRTLIATALGDGMTIITSERFFAAYGVATLW